MTQMAYIEIPETHRTSGKEAIQSINEYINELQQQTNKELTRKQKSAMIKFARGLITSIETEMQKKAAHKRTRKTPIMKQIRETILKGILEFGSASDESAWSVRPVVTPLPRRSRKPTATRDFNFEKDVSK